MNDVASLDVKLFFFINKDLGMPSLDPLMQFFSSDKVCLASALLFVSFCFYFKKIQTREFVFLILLSTVLADLFCFRMLKPYFSRLRPCYTYEEQVDLKAGRCGSDFGLPSNHAANTMAFSTALTWYWRKRKCVLLFLATTIVGFSRVYLGVHYPSDVLLGFLVGILFGSLSYLLYKHELIIPKLKRRES